MNTSSQILASILIALSISACSASNDSNTGEKKEATIETETGSEKAMATTADFPYAFEQVANNTWVMHGPREFPNPENKGFMNNPGIVETSAGLVVIDPGSTVHVGKNVLAEINKVSDKKIVAIFNTHVHGDHWLANQAIKMAYPEVKIYGHPNMIDEINNGEGENWLQTMETLTEGASLGTIVVAPDMAINNTEIIKIGDTQFKIHHFGIAHTKTDIMIEVIENSVVFMGDNVTSLRLPRTSDGTFQGNITSVKTMLESNAKTYVPGHGPTGGRAMVEEYINYLALVYKAAQQTFEEDLDSSDVIKITRETTAAYKDWRGYNDLLGPQGAQAYSEVEAAEF
jgi:glyoxylase-like metal-dependent hydrolase (beta-lactamase superfamily II)